MTAESGVSTDPTQQEPLEALASACTIKERMFAEHYAGSARGNATKAAELAGYKATRKASLTEVGYQNSRKLHVRAYIDALLNAYSRSAAEVIREVSDIAFQDLSPYLAVKGSELELDYAKMEREGALHLIAGFEFNKQGDSIPVIHSKLGALTLMVKIHKLGNEGVDANVNVTIVREYPEGV